MRREFCEKDGILITYTTNDVCFEEIETAESVLLKNNGEFYMVHRPERLVDILNEIADYLYEKETITGKQFMEIYHRIKGDLQNEDEQKESVDSDENVIAEDLSAKLAEDSDVED